MAMDKNQENASKDKKTTKPKRHQAPIVSLGKIIGYKLAGVTIKTLDILQKARTKRHNTSKPKDRLQDKIATKLNNKKVKRSVSFSDIIQERICETFTGERHDKNTNASQRKGSNTNVSNNRKDVKQSYPGQKTPSNGNPHKSSSKRNLTKERRNTNTNSKHGKGSDTNVSYYCSKWSGKQPSPKQKSSNNKLPHKSGSKRNLTKTPSRQNSVTKSKYVTETKKSPCLPNDQNKAKIRSTSAKVYVCRTRPSPPDDSKRSKSKRTLAMENHGQNSKTENVSRRKESSQLILSTRSHSNQRTKESTSVFKTLSTLAKHLDKFKYKDNNKVHDLSTSSNTDCVLYHTMSNKSPSKLASRHLLGKRRWADVVAGSSKDANHERQHSHGIPRSKQSKTVVVQCVTPTKRTRYSDRLKQKDHQRKKPQNSPISSNSNTVLYQVVSNKSPGKMASRHSLGRRRWADVVAGSSNVETKSVLSTCPLDTGRKGQINVSNSLEKESGPSLIKESKFSVVRKRNSRSTMVKDKTEPNPTSDQKKNVNSYPKHPSVPVVENYYQANFPSLEEQKGRNPKKEKWCQRKIVEERECGTKSIGNRIRRVGAGNSNLSFIRRSKGQGRMKLKKRTKTNINGTIDKTDRESKSATTNSSLNDTLYIVDNMQELMIQTVGKVSPLLGRSSTEECFVNGEASPFTIVAVNPMQVTHQQRHRGDMFNQLNRMSVDGNSLSRSSPLPNIMDNSKGTTRTTESPSSNIQRDASNSKLEEPGPSQKKVSAKYRSLLRKDYRKIGSKTPSQVSHRGHLTGMHQREKMYGQYDGHQQRCYQQQPLDTQRGEGTSGMTREPSQNLNPFNTLYYCIPNNNNGCPTM